MLINRLPIKQLIDCRLLASKQIYLNTQLKRFKWDDPFHNQRILYRNIGAEQSRIDWWLTFGAMAMLVSLASINVYMNWDEYKIADTPGFSYDNSRFHDSELGIPPDNDMTYAPLKKSLIDGEGVLDFGNTLRTENRWVYHTYARRAGMPSPYDH